MLNYNESKSVDIWLDSSIYKYHKLYDTNLDITKIDNMSEIQYWYQYWIAYMNAYKSLEKTNNTIATLYVGRHTIELGFKLMIIMAGSAPEFTHDLSKLATKAFSLYDTSIYNNIEVAERFLFNYQKSIESDTVECFRYPMAKNNAMFQNFELDGKWLMYSFDAIIDTQKYFITRNSDSFTKN